MTIDKYLMNDFGHLQDKKTGYLIKQIRNKLIDQYQVLDDFIWLNNSQVEVENLLVNLSYNK